MSLTVDDIREHVARLQGRLEEERHRVLFGTYDGHPAANYALIEALEGRVAELFDTCDRLEKQIAQRGEALSALL